MTNDREGSIYRAQRVAYTAHTANKNEEKVRLFATDSPAAPSLEPSGGRAQHTAHMSHDACLDACHMVLLRVRDCVPCVAPCWLWLLAVG
jgi:hypothetical protein